MIVVCRFVCVSVVESNVCGSNSLAEVGRTGACDGQRECGEDGSDVVCHLVDGWTVGGCRNRRFEKLTDGSIWDVP